MPSDIQVFVQWKEHTIFAGEDVECIITFKNVAETTSAEGAATQRTPPQRRTSRTVPTTSNSDSYFSLKSPSNPFYHNRRRSVAQSPLQKTFDRAHRPSASLSSPFGSSHSFPPATHTTRLSQGQSTNHAHKRSVSILSIDSESTNEKTPIPAQFQRTRPARGHGRSASLQVQARKPIGTEEIYSPGRRTLVHSNTSPLGYPSPTTLGNLKVDNDRNLRVSRPGSGTESPRSPAESSRSPNRRTAALLPTDFKFPPSAPNSTETETKISTAIPLISNTDASNSSAMSPKTINLALKDPPSLTQQAHLAPITKIMSSSSMNGSARSSGEFYSPSNNSTETLESEYTGTGLSRPPLNSIRHGRALSSVEQISRGRNASALLMGYAQISATFTVDGSLINQAAFEEVKRKGVVGGPGNSPRLPTVPEKSRKNHGLWGTFGWNTIEESINGLLSSGELNGLRDMRGVASSKSIPLLSTPQSLLFVDLRLSPGEERSFSFSFTLPKGLPASHKGKAVKFTYNLVIGTQRPSGPKETQQVNRINVPFRVFSGVNGRGDILGHDLMMPYVLLRDEAKVRKVYSNNRLSSKEKSISGPTWTSAPEFLNYVDEILEQNQLGSPSGPLTTPLERNPSREMIKSFSSCKDSIDLAILRSNQINTSNHSANRFEIARNGRRIAVVVLNRPAHRLGETILATIDFSDATLPCYSLRATLETSEKVDPSLAVRSTASIHRATRRIHATYFENTLFTTRVVFSPAIPISATPTLLTSGVRLDWELRFEFVTIHSNNEDDFSLSGADLLEPISEDDRGSIFSSLESLHCESFEISIPLTVYGETVREPLAEENQEFFI